MAETSGVTYPDVSTFGVSDTGLTQYRTPDPLPVPFRAVDYPYQPLPITVFALDPYRLSVPGLATPAFVTIAADGSRTFGSTRVDLLGSKFNPLADPRKPGDTRPIFLPKRGGGYYHDEDIRAANARVLAAYHLDNRGDLIVKALESGKVDAQTLNLINTQLPYVQQQREQAYYDVKVGELYERSQHEHGWREIVDPIVSLTAFVLMATPFAPFAAIAYAAYVVGNTTAIQVETGRVTGTQLVVEGLAVAGAYGSYTGYLAAEAKAADLALQPLPTVTTVSIKPVALSGSSLQASVVEASSGSITGTPALQAALFRQPIATALTPAAQLGGGVLTQSIRDLLPPTLLESAVTYVKQNPVQVATGIKESLDLGTKIDNGDWRGVVNGVIGFIGVPFQLPQADPIIITPQAPLRLWRDGGQGGSGMLFSSPANPASANPWPWIVGAGLLGLLLYMLRKG